MRRRAAEPGESPVARQILLLQVAVVVVLVVTAVALAAWDARSAHSREAGYPFRMRLLKHSPDVHVFSVAFLGASKDVNVRMACEQELWQCYEALVDEKPARSAQDEAETYWRQRFAALPAEPVPAAPHRSGGGVAAPLEIRFRFSGDPLRRMREAARRLRTGGRVINFSSSVVGLRQPSYGIYAATKAGIEALTSVLAKELRGRAITVNAIAPGPTATDLFLTGKSAELIEHYTRMAPLERLGTPEDIAAAVAFLASPDGGWINGQTLRANGGLI